MKTKIAVSLVMVLCSSVVFATEPASAQLQIYPKNLARQHLGSNLFLFNPSTQAFAPTEASAAWMDEDPATAWPILAGKQHYLLVLTEPELITNFGVSTRPATGTVTLYGGDQPAIPGANSWLTIARDIPLESVNNKKLSKSFSRFAKYILIETDIAEPGPLYSLYLYGEKSAVDYTLRKRDEPIDAPAIFGPYINDQTAFNANGLYASGRVTYANAPDGYLSWQKAIDDNPETGIIIAGTTHEAGAVIALGGQRYLSRVSVLSNPDAKGKLDLYAVRTSADAAGTARPVTDLTPTASLVFNGTNPRASTDLQAVEASEFAIRWTPDTEGDTITLREVSTFDSLSLSDYEVSGSLPVVAAYVPGETYGDGKTFKDVIDPKKNPDPVAVGPSSSYLPGSLGFPPIQNGRRLPPVEAESN